MSELRSDEIAIRRDLFNGLVDELTDALGWLLVIREENADVLARACGRLDAEQRLAQMNAILSGRTFDRRYQVDEAWPRDSACLATEEQEAPWYGSPSADERNTIPAEDLEASKRTAEEKRDEDSHNTKG